MDYNKTREDAAKRKQELITRQEQIRTDKSKLDHEMEQIKLELIGLDQILEGLEYMESGPPPDLEPVGFTDKIKHILQTTNVHLLPTQIRDALMNLGETGSSMKNLLIAVHSILARLEPFLATKEVSGKTAYKWKEPAVNAPTIPRHLSLGRTVPLSRLARTPAVGPPTDYAPVASPPQVRATLAEAVEEWAKKQKEKK